MRDRAPIWLLPLSLVVVACGDSSRTDAREALEREALERDLELALEADTTVQPQLTDVPPIPEPEPVAAPGPQPAPVTRAPEPAPRRTPVRREIPAPEREPEPVVRPEPREPARAPGRTVSAGTRFAVQTNQELSTRSAREGDVLSATLIEPILDDRGNVVIPAGATVRGRVTESRRASRGGQPVLQIAFDAISQGDRTYPIQGSIVGTVQTRRVSGDSRTEQAAKVAGGAAAGAVLGRVLGGNRGATLGGAVIGAAAGTAVAVGTAESDAVIDEGTTVEVRLDGPVRVND